MKNEQEIEIVTIAESNEKALAIIQENELSTDEATSLKNSMTPFFDQAEEWVEKAKALKVTDETQIAQMTEARTARLALKDIRVKLDKKRKELKEESVRKGRAIDGMANILKFLIEPIEDYLEKQEKFVENREIERTNKIEEDRKVQLEQFGVDTSFYQLREMPQVQFDSLLASTKETRRLQHENDQKLAREAQEKSEKEAEERRMQAEENAKLKADNDAKDALIQTEREAKAKLEAEIKAKEEKDKADETARLKAENDRKEAELKVERDAKAKLEQEAKAKAEAEQKEKDRIERERLAEEKRIADEALAKERMSDGERVKTIIDTLKAIRFPEVKSPDAKKLIADLEMDITKMITKVNNY